jgi:alpha-beta hydrolase superfamily lysophospholipase
VLRLPGTGLRETERRRLRVDEAFISYEVAGDGQPLVLVHGLGASGRWWARNVRGLSRHFRVYVIDLIGFGWSGGQSFALENASAYLAKWMDAVGIDRASFVGHSMGGYIVADLASVAHFPNLTAELRRRGYAEEDIEKILGGNILRVMEEVEKR